MKSFPHPPLLMALLMALPMMAFVMACGDGDEATEERQQEAAAVQAVAAEARDLRETVTDIGTIRARETVEIQPEIAGIVERVFYTEARPVEKGDRLFVLEDDQLKSQLASERSRLSAARSSLSLARHPYPIRAAPGVERRGRADL